MGGRLEPFNFNVNHMARKHLYPRNTFAEIRQHSLKQKTYTMNITSSVTFHSAALAKPSDQLENGTDESENEKRNIHWSTENREQTAIDCLTQR